MANPPKPWKVEYAKSGRSSCRSCKSNIEKEALRLGKMVQSSQFDGFMPVCSMFLHFPILVPPCSLPLNSCFPFHISLFVCSSYCICLFTSFEHLLYFSCTYSLNNGQGMCFVIHKNCFVDCISQVTTQFNYLNF